MYLRECILACSMDPSQLQLMAETGSGSTSVLWPKESGSVHMVDELYIECLRGTLCAWGLAMMEGWIQEFLSGPRVR